MWHTYTWLDVQLAVDSCRHPQHAQRLSVDPPVNTVQLAVAFCILYVPYFMAFRFDGRMPCARSGNSLDGSPRPRSTDPPTADMALGKVSLFTVADDNHESLATSALL